MARVTLVVQAAAWPARSGIGRRVEALHEALSAEHDVDVVACLPPTADAGPPERGRYRRLDRPAGGVRAAPRLAVAFARGRPLTSAFYESKGLRAQLAKALRATEPDVVVAQGLASAQLVRGLTPDQTVIVDLADAEHERVLGIGRSGGWRKAPYRLDSARIARWCSRRLPLFAAATVVSQHDLDSYQRLAPGARVVLCPNGTSVRDEAPDSAHDPRLLFLGDLEYEPNAAGLEWFTDAVLPRLADVTLRVVGRGPVRSGPRVEHVGYVPDLGPEWARAVALVVPLFVGGGTRIKVLDALGAGVPVISTALGVAGLEVEPDVHYLAADTADEMADAIARLLKDPALRARLAAAGRDLVVQRYTWEQCLGPLKAEVRRLGS